MQGRGHVDRGYGCGAGESRGLMPLDYDFGNSPFEMSMAQVDGQRLIQATSNGTVGLGRCSEPTALLAASARNVSATARWVRANHGGEPWTILCTGRTEEDWACARHLSDLLQGVEPERERLVAGVMDGVAELSRSFAHRPAADRVDLSVDLPFCCDVDRSDFAMVGEIRDDHVVLTKVPA
ncbi:2-phosphosulfolactate phosphatase [Winogradskya consettensis]|nr:2-phosphosulfolactate phosphatase [Actinoplanes consettensis]